MAETYSVAGSFALTASSTKAFAQVVTSSTQACRIVVCDVGIDDVSKTTLPLVQIVRFTSTFTAATGGTAFTPDRLNGEGQSIAFPGATVTVGAFTAEAVINTGTLRVIKNWYASALPFLWPLGREVYCPPSVTTVLRVVTGATIPANMSYNIELES